MSFRFAFTGGVRKPQGHTLEKFLMFFVIGGSEIPFYQALRDGIVMQEADAVKHVYVTNHKVAKIFVSEQGFGIRKRYYSFYVEFQEPPAAQVTVKPFDTSNSPYWFQSRVRFLGYERVAELFNGNAEYLSVRLFKYQETLPLDLLHRMVAVDRSEVRKNVRFVRVGSRKKSEKEVGALCPFQEVVQES